MRFANGEGADAVADARRVLGALRDTEAAVLYPAFSRVSLRPETQQLLDDCRDGRAQQLAALDALAHKRSGRLRKLAVVQLVDLVHHFSQQHIGLLIPVLSSQLPRQLYRSIVQAFTSHYEGSFDQGAHAHASRRRQRTINANA
jgi:DNA invertase Pin-like site-specific DNA recombinase